MQRHDRGAIRFALEVWITRRRNRFGIFHDHRRLRGTNQQPFEGGKDLCFVRAQQQVINRGRVVCMLGKPCSGGDVVNRDRLFRVLEQHIGEEFRKRHHLPVAQHNVIDVSVQHKHRRFAAQIAAPQVFCPSRKLTQLTHTSNSLSPIGFKMRSVSAAVCLIDSTPSSSSSSCPVNSCGDCIVTI